MIDILDLNHVTLVVRDLDAARRFYGNVLGMEEVPRPPAAQHAIAWMRKGSAEIHLIHAAETPQLSGDAPAAHAPGRDVSLARHLAFAVRDADATVAALTTHGIPIYLGPRPRGDGATQIFCFDPDGHLVELHTLPS